MSVLSPFDKKVDVKEKPEKRTLEIPSLRQTGVRQQRLEKRQRLSNKEKNPTNFVKKKKIQKAKKVHIIKHSVKLLVLLSFSFHSFCLFFLCSFIPLFVFC